MKIEKCRSCGSLNIQQFFDLHEQPFANALLKNISDYEGEYPLSLSYCKDCSLTQLDYTADPKELFSNYFWVTSTSSTAREYSKFFCENALKRFNTEINYVLEIASNDGTFLKPFKEKGLDVLGIDPAQNIAKIACEEGINTQVDFFGDEVARKVVRKKGTPAIIYARNVLPHVANLHGFVEGLKICCGDNSLLILEIHYFGKILDELHYDSIYHEHLCYFTLKSVTKLLNQAGLFVYDVEKSPISGGSIVLYIKNTQQAASESLKALKIIEEKNRYNDFEKLQEFAIMSFEHKKLLNEIIDKELEKGKKIVGYGASARSSTMLNFCGIDNRKLIAIADQNALKQGLLTPGTHIPILSPEETLGKNPDTILLLAWNFKDEILEILRNRFNFKGNIIIPLPNPPIMEEI